MFLTTLTSIGLAAIVFVAILLGTAHDAAEQRKSRKRADLVKQRLQDEESRPRVELREIQVRLKDKAI
jgi:hypothetical protein